ncbi:hypothetical protein CIB48_g11003 [Xylaria polymorpha]|nr:hypothetical protein CIB48_g11003 [Xylaria polymorpha]
MHSVRSPGNPQAFDNPFIQNQRSRPNVAAATDIVELRADCCPPGLTKVGWGLLLEVACSPVDIRGEAATLPAVIRKLLEDSGINPNDAANNSLYLAARRLFFLLQDTVNPSSEELLQAGILITLLISSLNLDDPRPSLIAYNESQHDMSWLGRLGSLAALDESFRDFPELIKFYVTAQTAYNVGDALHQPLRLCDATSFAISVLVALRHTDYLRKPLETQVNSAKVLCLNSSLNMVHEIVRTTTKSTTDRHIGDHSFTGIVSVLRAAIHLAAARGQSLDIKDWDEIEKLLIPFSERWGVGEIFAYPYLEFLTPGKDFPDSAFLKEYSSPREQQHAA